VGKRYFGRSHPAKSKTPRDLRPRGVGSIRIALG